MLGMTIEQTADIGLALAALIAAVGLFVGLICLARAIKTTPDPVPQTLRPKMPKPSKEDVEKLVERFREMKEKRDNEYAGRGGQPEPTNTRPGRHVNV